MDIIVNGARGRMGQEVCRLLQEDGHRAGRRGWTVPARTAAMPSGRLHRARRRGD